MSESVVQPRVTVDDVRHIAELSNLRLTPQEEVLMQRDLSAILNYVAELNELDTSVIEPMSQVREMLVVRDAHSGDSRATLRADEPRPSLQREAVMVSAPETDGSFFKVPKVIDR